MKKKHKPRRIKKNSSNKIMGFAIALIMISSIAGIMTSNTESSYDYEGHKLKLKGNYFTIKIGGEEMRFNYHPSDLRNLELNEEILKRLDSQMIYLTFNPENENLEYIDRARLELSEEMMKKGKYILNGKMNESEYYDLEIITCENSTVYAPVIQFVEANVTEIILEGTCIIAKSDSKEGFIAIKDRIMYGLNGILK